MNKYDDILKEFIKSRIDNINPQSKEPHEFSDQYAKVVQQAYEDGFVQGKIYEQSGRVSCGKTIPKEPQYLYVYARNGLIDYMYTEPRGWSEDYIGRIKLEVGDE